MDKNRDYAQVLEEKDDSGNLLVSYVYGDDLVRQERGGADFYYHYDGQLSTRQLTDASGNVTDTYTYDAFGDVLSQAGTTENSYMYTGEQYDPNAAAYYLRARYYDPAAGRFLSSDPYAGRQSEPVTLHKYLYANANPLKYHDPSGEVSSLIELTEVNNMLTNLQRISVTGSRILGMYDKACSVRDIIMGIIKILDYIGNTSDFSQAFPKPADMSFDFKFRDAASEFLLMAKEGIGKGTPNWTAGYIRHRVKGRKLKSYIIYMPTFFGSIEKFSKIGAINHVPVKIGFGSPGKGRLAGRLMGIGVEMGENRELLRMDLGPLNENHGGETGLRSREITVIEGDLGHMHVNKWGS